MMVPSAPLCGHPGGCGNRTRSPSGRCHVHEHADGDVVSTEPLVTGTVPPSAATIRDPDDDRAAEFLSPDAHAYGAHLGEWIGDTLPEHCTRIQEMWDSGYRPVVTRNVPVPSLVASWQEFLGAPHGGMQTSMIVERRPTRYLGFEFLIPDTGEWVEMDEDAPMWVMETNVPDGYDHRAAMESS